jgi:hypothetical protein
MENQGAKISWSDSKNPLFLSHTYTVYWMRGTEDEAKNYLGLGGILSSIFGGVEGYSTLPSDKTHENEVEYMN